MAYFKNFPKFLYSTSLGVRNYKLVPNILAKVTFLREALQNSDVYYKYHLKDGEKPEDVAFKFYKDPAKHWIILLANEIIDPQYDWPLGQQAFEDYINKKYSSYNLYLDPTETYTTSYTVGEIAYQGGSIDASSAESTVLSFDSTNKILKVNNITEVFANNTIVSGATSDVSHKMIGITCDENGKNYSTSTISHYSVTQVKWNSYDEVKTTETFKVSAKDYNFGTDAVIDRTTSSQSALLQDGTTLNIERSYVPVYYYDYENELNEQKRFISVPKAEYTNRIEQQFKLLMEK